MSGLSPIVQRMFERMCSLATPNVMREGFAEVLDGHFGLRGVFRGPSRSSFEPDPSISSNFDSNSSFVGTDLLGEMSHR